MGIWGWRQSEGWLRFALVLIIPLIAAIVWGTFAVPNGPSRSEAAPIAGLGILRLAIEIAVFIFAAWALYDVGFTRLNCALGIIVAIYYLTSYDHILWLIRQ